MDRNLLFESRVFTGKGSECAKVLRLYLRLAALLLDRCADVYRSQSLIYVTGHKRLGLARAHLVKFVFDVLSCGCFHHHFGLNQSFLFFRWCVHLRHLFSLQDEGVQSSFFGVTFEGQFSFERVGPPHARLSSFRFLSW